MAATNWTIIRREKATNQMVTFNLGAKWTYKTAIRYRDWETMDTSTFEIICVVETNKIMIKNDKEEKKKSNI